MSEFLREKQGNRQIPQQQNGEDEGDPRDQIHELPQFLARLDVEKRQDEEDRSEKKHGNVLHRKPQSGAHRSETHFACLGVVRLERRPKEKIKIEKFEGRLAYSSLPAQPSGTNR
jgi:hypothetical protein